MIPIKDDNPTKTLPFITVGLILLNVTAFFYELSLGSGMQKFIALYGAVPQNMIHGESDVAGPHLPAMVTVTTSMFLHGGLLHLGGNMLYLWIFGNNIEDTLGHIRFLLFYLVCGYIGAYGHAFTDPTSSIPMVGASGAISGVLGAYLLLFPTARVLTLIPIFFFIHFVWIPAFIVLGFWIVVQFLNGVLSQGSASGGVAWFAHIGGFLSGMVLLFFFKKPKTRSTRK